MKSTTLAEQITRLRAEQDLTMRELAARARVPRSLLSGLVSGSRRVGQLQATKIGAALGLAGEELDQFVLRAIDTCSEKVLNESKDYPAELINLITRQLRRAGILGQSIRACSVIGDEHEQDVTLHLGNGSMATLKTQLMCA